MSVLSKMRSWFVPREKREANTSCNRDGTSSDAALPPGLRRRSGGIEGATGDAKAPAVPPVIRRLADAGLPAGPTAEEAIALLRNVCGTVLEAAALEAVLSGPWHFRAPDPVRVACADILAARGDDRGALSILEGVSSTPGLLLASDLYAGSGQLPRAVGTIERVLARDITAPGARERHDRWTEALGSVKRPLRQSDTVTVVAADPQGAPFRLLREVARGGAGVVYEAEDAVLGRRVAFKVYHGRGKDREAIERESRAAVSLEGPGVVRVFDADAAAGWIAVEWIPRGSVRDILSMGDLTVLSPLRGWLCPLARALARLHARGVVHADVKPANILLRAPRDPVLGDFGIAHRVGERVEGGSAGYLSPERIAGRPSDPSDDIYGFGRVVEDVLHRMEGASGDPDADGLRALALVCMRSAGSRPRDGTELVARLATS